MSSKANKQRMKRRLIDALCRHDPDLDFERVVMGDQFRLWTRTHKQLKLMLRLGARYTYVNDLAATIDGIMVKSYTCVLTKNEQRKARRRRHITTSVSR